jgi:hypothetical protein
VFHYDRDWPQVFGLSFSAGALPVDGLGVGVWWSAGGKSVLGDGAGVRFTEYRGGAPGASLTIGPDASFEVGLEPIEVHAEGTRAEVMRKLFAGPASFTAETSARIDALETAVSNALDADTPRKCIYGEYQGNGIPPNCERKVPLSEDEKAAARERLETRLTGERAMLAASSGAMHARLVQLLPATCWTPPG